jgi:hypothetical protein
MAALEKDYEEVGADSVELEEGGEGEEYWVWVFNTSLLNVLFVRSLKFLYSAK